MQQLEQQKPGAPSFINSSTAGRRPKPQIGPEVGATLHANDPATLKRPPPTSGRGLPKGFLKSTSTPVSTHGHMLTSIHSEASPGSQAANPHYGASLNATKAQILSYRTAVTTRGTSRLHQLHSAQKVHQRNWNFSLHGQLTPCLEGVPRGDCSACEEAQEALLVITEEQWRELFSTR